MLRRKKKRIFDDELLQNDANDYYKYIKPINFYVNDLIKMELCLMSDQVTICLSLLSK